MLVILLQWGRDTQNLESNFILFVREILKFLHALLLPILFLTISIFMNFQEIPFVYLRDLGSIFWLNSSLLLLLIHFGFLLGEAIFEAELLVLLAIASLM